MGQNRSAASALVTVVVLAFAGSACSTPDAPVFRENPRRTVLVVGHREGKLASFPCSGCHDKIDTSNLPAPTGPNKHRTLEFGHFEGVELCDNCHDGPNRDRLRLLTGKTIRLNDSHLLCGQCHSERLKDWTIGAHGKHVGGWSGTKHRLACADCHNPHKPGLSTTVALPAPPFPNLGIPKGAH